MEEVFLQFLGAVRIERGGKPICGFRSRKALALLGYLAVQARPVPREQLVDLFWGELAEARGRANLSWVLNRVSTLLPGCLEADSHTVRFQRIAPYRLDLDAFNALEAQGNAASLAAAVELYRGEFLEGLYLDDCPEFEVWLVGEREHWRQQTARVQEKLVAHHERHGEYEQALRFAQRLLALEPWHEGTHRRVMRLLARSGQPEAALAQYRACCRILADELGTEPTAETTALYERIRAAISTRRHHLPPQPTPFVGREAELAEITRLLDDPDCRLVTLVGPGGIGKTRLALQAAADKIGAFLEGVYFVPLTGVSSPEFLASAIAAALQFPFSGPSDPRQQLLDYLREKEMLLVLDSFEHLLEGTALLAEILQGAPEVKLLVTSRERLNLRWEWCYEVEGLPYPQHDKDADPANYGAVCLFRQTAHQVSQHFALSPRNATAVARICRLVEGMPLAVELAAAWTTTHTCEEIAEEIERDLGFLAAPLRDLPDRHRSVRAAFEHSWRLLTPPERQVLMRLSVFRGFSSAAAGEVAAATPAILRSLADKSLLRRTPSGRYEMHELLRQYAGEKLAATLTADEIRDRHCAYYATLLQQQEAVLVGADAAQAVAAIKEEMGNVHAAWHRAATQARLEEIGRSMDGLSRFYTLAGPFQEAAMLFGMAAEHVRTLAESKSPPGTASLIMSRLLVEQARFLNRCARYEQAAQAAGSAVDGARADPAADIEAAARAQWGIALWNLGNYAAAHSQLERALDLARATRSRRVEAGALFNLGWVCWHLGDYGASGDYFRRALSIYREIGDRQGESAALRQIGVIAQVCHNYTEARTYYEQTLALCREIGERHCEAIALSNLGLACTQQGDYAEAGAYYERALQIGRELGSRRTEGVALINLGYALDQQGDYAGARIHYEQSLRIYREIGDRQSESLTLACLGLLAHHLGDDEMARERCLQALRIAREIGNRRVEGYVLTRLGHALAGLGRLAEAAEIYRQALTLQRELGQANLAMEPLAGLARVALAQGDVAQAQAHVAEVLAHLEAHTVDGADEPLRVYLTCYRVLSAAGDPRAHEVLATAYHLLQERADRIGDEGLHRAFLENVAAHRQIVEAADEEA